MLPDVIDLGAVADIRAIKALTAPYCCLLDTEDRPGAHGGRVTRNSENGEPRKTLGEVVASWLASSS